jgi:hypothetical protein
MPIIEARVISHRIDETHLNGGKDAFAVILRHIVEADDVAGSRKQLRVAGLKLIKEARSHKWLEDPFFLEALGKIVGKYMVTAKPSPIPTNIATIRC